MQDNGNKTDISLRPPRRPSFTGGALPTSLEPGTVSQRPVCGPSSPEQRLWLSFALDTEPSGMQCPDAAGICATTFPEVWQKVQAKAPQLRKLNQNLRQLALRAALALLLSRNNDGHMTHE